MEARDKFVLMGVLRNSGLSYLELSAFIDYVSDKFEDTTRLINSGIKINDIVRYFKDKEYPLNLIAKIVLVSIGKVSVEKVIKVDEMILSNGYSVFETQRVEAKDTHNVFMNNPNNTSIKLSFYNDINVKEEIVKTSFRLRQPLELSFARHRFLMDRRYKLSENKSVMFLSECDFRDLFRVWNCDLIDKYPIDNPKYMVKK